MQAGGTEMNRKTLLLIPVCLLLASTSAAQTCEYKPGETKFLDYALCRYAEDSIEVIQLPEGSNWETCIYHVQPFRPAKLLAVTKVKDGKEVASVNNRSQIGNPCYLTKQYCDQAYKASQQ
jgi:hypothetical protein